MSGKMWACPVAGGSMGKLSCPVCVDVMLEPLGMVAVIPGWDGVLLATEVCGSRKWPVQPVSAMAIEVWVSLASGV